jgi:hypothetical protein
MREFDGGATRDGDEGKIDPDGYLSPEALGAFFAYMQKHQTCADKSTRSSSNWKAGIPREVYLKSLWRHFFTAWTIYRDTKDHTREEMIEALCGVMFNTQGLLHEILKEQDEPVRELPPKG